MICNQKQEKKTHNFAGRWLSVLLIIIARLRCIRPQFMCNHSTTFQEMIPDETNRLIMQIKTSACTLTWEPGPGSWQYCPSTSGSPLSWRERPSPSHPTRCQNNHLRNTHRMRNQLETQTGVMARNSHRPIFVFVSNNPMSHFNWDQTDRGLLVAAQSFLTPFLTNNRQTVRPAAKVLFFGSGRFWSASRLLFRLAVIGVRAVT